MFWRINFTSIFKGPPVYSGRTGKAFRLGVNISAVPFLSVLKLKSLVITCNLHSFNSALIGWVPWKKKLRKLTINNINGHIQCNLIYILIQKKNLNIEQSRARPIWFWGQKTCTVQSYYLSKFSSRLHLFDQQMLLFIVFQCRSLLRLMI